MTVPAAISDVLHREWYHNSLQAWLTGALTAAVLSLLLIVVRKVLVSRLGAIAEKTTNLIDDMVVALIGATRTWVIVGFSAYIGSKSLALPAIDPYLIPAIKLFLLWQSAVWGAAAITFWVKHHLATPASSGDRTGIAMINAMGIGAKVLLWILVIITALKSVFAIEITPLITGLGVSGIAVALAVQNILGDLLAALSIVFDKPFDVGDTIGVDQITGVVEHIGLKTTRIRSISGEQIIIGNADLLKSRVHNFRRMYQRRVLFSLDVPYDTPLEVVRKLPGIVEQIVAAQTPVKFDRCHVAEFEESAMRLETVYFVLDKEYRVYMDVQQAINLEILKQFAAVNVKFAFPSRTVYHEGPLARDAAGPSRAQGSAG